MPNTVDRLACVGAAWAAANSTHWRLKPPLRERWNAAGIVRVHRHSSEHHGVLADWPATGREAGPRSRVGAGFSAGISGADCGGRDLGAMAFAAGLWRGISRQLSSIRADRAA